MKKAKASLKNKTAAVDALAVLVGVLLMVGIALCASWSIQLAESARRETQSLLKMYGAAGRPVTQQLEDLDLNSCHDLLLSMRSNGLSMEIEGRAIKTGSQMVNACRWNPNPKVTFWNAEGSR